MSTHQYKTSIGTICRIDESDAAKAVLQQLGGASELPKIFKCHTVLDATADSLYLKWGFQNVLRIKPEQGGTYTVVSYQFSVNNGLVKNIESNGVAATQLVAKVTETIAPPT